MATHIALLRAVNLGPHNKIAMADLRDLLGTLGLKEPKTLLQSGNVVFTDEKRAGDKLELLLERGAEKHLRLSTPFFVRDAKAWSKIVAGNPYEREAKSDPGHLVLLTMKSAPTATAISALQESIRGRETFHVRGAHAYAYYPDGIGESKFTIALIERKLSTSVTGRNWNTVLKIAALLS